MASARVRMGLLVLLGVLGVIRPSPPARAQDDPGLASVAAIAEMIEHRAETLTRSADLTIDAMQRYAWELDGSVSMLVSASSPYPTLSALLPDMRVTMSSLMNAAWIGTASEVEDEADTLLDQIHSFQVYVRNLQP